MIEIPYINAANTTVIIANGFVLPDLLLFTHPIIPKIAPAGIIKEIGAVEPIRNLIRDKKR